MDFVAIDFETANSARHSVCAVGIAEVSQGEIINATSWLVRPPELYFSPVNISIHGITANQVKHEPEFITIWPMIRKICKDRPIIAHNASFDISVIRHASDFYRQRYPTLDYFCTIAVAKAVWPGLMNYRLPTVAEHLNISLNHHDPAEDAAAAAEITIQALRESQCTDLFQLSAQIGIRAGKLYPGGYQACR